MCIHNCIYSYIQFEIEIFENIFRYQLFNIHTHIYIYIYIYMCVPLYYISMYYI